eukprot:m.195854 g.195854  ORF g.195854 m.195854 type:complete len:161 (+) comp15460_c7_seq17:1-483(+)
MFVCVCVCQFVCLYLPVSSRRQSCLSLPMFSIEVSALMPSTLFLFVSQRTPLAYSTKVPPLSAQMLTHSHIYFYFPSPLELLSPGRVVVLALCSCFECGNITQVHILNLHVHFTPIKEKIPLTFYKMIPLPFHPTSQCVKAPTHISPSIFLVFSFLCFQL